MTIKTDIDTVLFASLYGLGTSRDKICHALQITRSEFDSLVDSGRFRRRYVAS